MTFYEAIVPVCLQMYCSGEIALNDLSQWGFKHRTNNLTVEARASQLSGDYRSHKWDKLCEECKKAAAICKLIENSPLAEALA